MPVFVERVRTFYDFLRLSWLVHDKYVPSGSIAHDKEKAFWIFKKSFDCPEILF